MGEYVGMIRADKKFMDEFNAGADLLQNEYQINRRDANGYLVFYGADVRINELQLNIQLTGRELSKKYAGTAVDILKGQGANARVNEIGFISIGNP